MKKILILSLLFALCLSAKDAGEYLDNIVAVVNDDVVTKSELNRSLSIARLQMREQGDKAAPSNLQQQVLDQLINKKLQLQIAKQVGITFSDADIDRIVQNLAEKNNVSVDGLYQRVNHEGMSTADYRKELQEQMTVQKLQQQEIASRIVVTPDEINMFMRNKFASSGGARAYHFEDILISLPDEPSSDAINKAKKQAETIIASMQSGKKVADVIKNETDVSSNDLGWRTLAQLPSIFADNAADMKANQISEPIRAPNGYHILYLVADRAVAADNAPDRSQVEQLLMQRKFEEHVASWVSKMRSQAYINTKMTT